MMDGFGNTGLESCAPEDCSSCTADCSSRMDLNSNVLELTTDEGEKIRCQILLNYTMTDEVRRPEGRELRDAPGYGMEERKYMAVLPLEDNPDGDIYLFRVAASGTALENIEDPEEHQRAARAFGIAMEKAQRERLSAGQP